MSCTRPLLLAVAIATICFSVLILTVTPGQAASAQLSWVAPTKNADGTPLTDLAGYKVYLRLADQTFGTGIDVGKTTTYTLSGLTSGLAYFVAVKAYDTSNNESAFSAEACLLCAAVANFTATPTSGTAPLAVSFTDTSTGAITSWSWKFGDGGTSTQRNPTYTYNTPGTYDVTLTVSTLVLPNTVTKQGYIAVSQPPVSSSGLVAAYSFDEGTGTTVTDTSGKGNNGAISGAIWTSSGRYGKALVFDGVNDWVTVPDSSSLDLTSGMSLEAWVYPTALSGGTTNGWRTVIMKEQSNQLVYSLNANSDANRPNSYVYTSSDLGVSGNAQLPLNTWTHLASTYDGAVLRVYVNGSQVGSRSLTGNIKTSGYSLHIGGSSVWGEYFQGRIDEVRIYNRALAASEVQTDMNKAVATSTSGALRVSSSRVPSKLGDILSALGKSALPLGRAGQQAANGFSTSRASTTTAVASGLLTSDHVEVGELVVDHQWKRVDLRKPFTDPIVVAKALSYRDGTPAVVGMRQTDATGFELRLQSWDESSQPLAAETVGYLVIERGRFQLADGTSLESGTVDIDPAYPVHTMAFSQPFRVAPAVMTATTTVQDAITVIGRPMRVSKQGLQFHLQALGRSHPLDGLQTFSYLAWEPSTSLLDGLVFEVGTTRMMTREQFQTIPYQQIFATAPVFLADIQSSRGGNPINVRWDQKDLEGIDVKMDDAPDLGAEGTESQDTDVVGYILIQNAPSP